jgi:hypothetical protein
VACIQTPTQGEVADSEPCRTFPSCLDLVGLALSASFAYADQPAPGQDKLEAALKAQGFTHWKSLVLDNGTWEVDDAINSADKQFDLRVDATTLKTTSQIAE